MAVTINGMTIDLPKDWAATQLKNAFQASVVGRLSPSIPMPLGDYVIPQYDGGFEVGYVPEMGRKPVSDVTMSQKKISPIKLAGIVIVSEEAARRNPADMLSFIEQDMRNAISRGIDYAVLYGKSPLDGSAIPGAASINATTNRVEIDWTKDLVTTLVNGYKMVDQERAEPSGWAFDSSLRAQLALAAQQQVTLPGAPAPMPDLRANGLQTLAGLPAAFGRVVSGRIGTQVDTKVRGFLGDWSKLRWGYATSIEMKRSTEASIVVGANTINLFQDNAMALLIEVMVGWTVMNNAAFVAYEDQVAG